MDVAQMGCRARKKSRKWHFPLLTPLRSSSPHLIPLRPASSRFALRQYSDSNLFETISAGLNRFRVPAARKGLGLVHKPRDAI